MKIAKETKSSFKAGSTTKGSRGISVAAKNPAQMRGRTNPKGASGHAASSRASSAGRKSSAGKGSTR